MVADLEVGTGRTGGRDATTGVIPGKYALSVGCPDIKPPSGWKWTALSSVAQLESGHTPSRKHPEYWDGGIPWIGIKDATENHGRTIHDTHQHVSDLGLQNSSARLLPANTVCLSRTASVGFVVVMGRPMATSQDFVNWICGPEIDPHFLKYVLLLENEALWRFARGTTHQTIYYPEAKAFHVCLPPLLEQRAIARILGTLDDKIELNRRMNATLEAMARALFQSWFVDFDPVHAKASGRPPSGMDAPTAALFPSSLQDSPLGEIPAGWKVGKLGEFLEVGIGGAWGEETATAKQTVAVKCLRGIDCHDLAQRSLPEIPIRYIGQRQFDDRKLTEGCVLVEGSGSFCGRSMLWLNEYSALTGQSVCYSNFCKRLDPKCTPSQALVCWMQFRKAYDDGGLSGFRTGTAFPNFDIHGALSGLNVTCPSPEVADAFLTFYRNWLRLDLLAQSRTLATLRDTLLPKLLSGELSVAGFEKEVEHA